MKVKDIQDLMMKTAAVAMSACVDEPAATTVNEAEAEVRTLHEYGFMFKQAEIEMKILPLERMMDETCDDGKLMRVIEIIHHESGPDFNPEKMLEQRINTRLHGLGLTKKWQDICRSASANYELRVRKLQADANWF